jgi:hypothetical protein
MRKLSMLVGVLALLTAGSAFSRDGYQDRPHVCDMPAGPRFKRCDDWISSVQRPDIRGASCCGDGDAFIADDFELGPKGELYAIITGDYHDVQYPGTELDDGSLPPLPYSVKRGTRILIPKEKRNIAPEDANRSGHGVVFLMPSDGSVLCYFAPPLI